MPLQIPLAGEIGYREADPKGDAEELSWFEVGEPCGGEEDPHDGPGRRNSQQNRDGSHHPFAITRLVLKEE